MCDDLGVSRVELLNHLLLCLESCHDLWDEDCCLLDLSENDILEKCDDLFCLLDHECCVSEVLDVLLELCELGLGIIWEKVAIDVLENFINESEFVV